MTKEEFLEAKKQRIENLSLEQLKIRYYDLDKIAMDYFCEMNKSHEKIRELEMQLSSVLSLLTL